MTDGFDRLGRERFATRSEVMACSGMAATSQPLATQVAIDILKQGGSAVDAAIAANAAQGLMEPMACGVGGDLFALVWDAESGALHGLNASGRSPRGLTLEHFRRQQLERIPGRGPLPVSVPGAVDGWWELHTRFGRLPMGQLLAPAIRYAREGFPVSEVIAWQWERDAAVRADYPGFAATFMPGGRAPRKGEIFRNPALAETYTRLASDGRDAFYRGEIAGIIEAYMARNGGFICREDLASHRSEWVEPVACDYRGYTVWELPPNGQGIAVLQMLNILEAYDVRAMGFGSVDYLHLLIEAKKLAYEDRARFYADPAFSAVPVAALIAKSYAARRRRLIDSGKAALRFPDGRPGDRAVPEHGDTAYLSVADNGGNMVSLIQSNYSGMGSGMTPDGLGFVLQNRGELFSLEEGHANVYAPGKRPFHTIIPAFVTVEGKPWLSFGVMGGVMQPQAQVQVLVNLIDFGMNLQEAGDAPRMCHRGSSEPTGGTMDDGGTVFLEAGFDDALRAGLEGLGHRVRAGEGAYGGYQAILRDDTLGVYLGASESRKDGQAAGY